MAVKISGESSRGKQKSKKKATPKKNRRGASRPLPTSVYSKLKIVKNVMNISHDVPFNQDLKSFLSKFNHMSFKNSQNIFLFRPNFGKIINKN